MIEVVGSGLDLEIEIGSVVISRVGVVVKGRVRVKYILL